MALPLQFFSEARSKPELTLLASCSNTKTSAIEPHLRARSLESTRVDQRAEEWVSRLQASGVATRQAKDLYGGAHWSTMRNLADALEPTWSVSLRVLSAGYGLVDSNAWIKPYSATFTSQSPDRVATAAESPLWWSFINASLPIDDTERRTVADIVAGRPSATFVVIASSSYLRAMTADLQAAASVLTSPTRLLIFSAGSTAIPGLESHMVRFDSRLHHLVGGSNVSLNAKVAAYVLTTVAPGALEVSSASAILDRVTADLDPISRPSRQPLTDEEVLDFIVEASPSLPNMSATAALRRLRDKGFACEQKRFHALYKEAMNAAD